MKINENTLKYSKYLGTIFGIVSIIFVLIPMLTVPLVPKTGLWYALYQKGDSNLQKEIYVGFWGVCGYDVDSNTHQIQDKTCTTISLAYSFKLFNHQFNENKTPNQNSVLEIDTTQTTVLVWYPIISILILIGMILSTSKHFKNSKKSSICYFVSSIITFSVYAGTLMIFLELKKQFLQTELQTQTQDLIPIRQQLLLLTHLPLVSGSLSLVNSLGGLIRFTYLKDSQDEETIKDEQSKVELGDDNSIHSIDSNQTILNEHQFVDEKFINHQPLPPVYHPSKSIE